MWANLDAQLINDINQTNQPAGRVSALIPSYIGFPGNLTAKSGYAFTFGPNNNFGVIPYANAGLIMNINSYNFRANSGSIVSAIASSRYLQFGGGARVEYAPTHLFAVYGDILLANLDDQSALNYNAWRNTTSLGLSLNPGSTLQLGVKGYYDQITPYRNTNNLALTQSSLGGELSIGIRY